MEKYIIIPKGSEKQYQKLIFVWHTGIDATETKDGNFTLNESVLPVCEKYNKTVFGCLKAFSLKNEEEIVFNVQQEMIES